LARLSCPWAEQGLALHNTGRALLCCHSRSYLQDDSNEWIYWHTHTLDDAWNSPTRHEILDSLAKGIEHPNCEACWQEERAGRNSRRLAALTQFPYLPPSDTPLLLDLKLGNTCNLACTMCWPEVSSKWLNDYYAVYEDPNIIYSDYKKRWASIQQSYDRDNHQLWGDLKTMIKQAVHIDIFGAEPMLLDRLWEILAWSAEQGYSKNQTVHINTNSTIWREDYYKILTQFQQVDIDLSIDATGPLFEYIRYGTTWQNVNDNILKWGKLQHQKNNFSVALCITVSNANVYYLDEIFESLTEFYLPFFFNLVHMPEHQSVRCLPEQVKDIVYKKLVDTDSKRPIGYQREIQTVLNFMMLDDKNQETNFAEWMRSTKVLDSQRGNNYGAVAQEFIEVLAQQGHDFL